MYFLHTLEGIADAISLIISYFNDVEMMFFAWMVATFSQYRFQTNKCTFMRDDLD